MADDTVPADRPASRRRADVLALAALIPLVAAFALTAHALSGQEMTGNFERGEPLPGHIAIRAQIELVAGTASAVAAVAVLIAAAAIRSTWVVTLVGVVLVLAGLAYALFALFAYAVVF